MPYEEEKSKKWILEERKRKYQENIRRLKDIGAVPEDFTIQDAREGSGKGLTEFEKLMDKYRNR